MPRGYTDAGKEMTALERLNRARKNALIDRSVPGIRLRKNWCYLANRSLLCEEEWVHKDLIISDIISFSYLPNLRDEERWRAREKIFLFLSDGEADEDEMLSLACELSKKAKEAPYPKKVTELVLSTPLGMRLKSGKLAPDDDCLTSLCGPSPLFAHLLNRSEGNVGSLYEFLSLIESTPEDIMDRHKYQEHTIKKFLSEGHYAQLFYFLLLLNRQGKYLYLDPSGLRPENFNAELIRIRNRKPAVVIGLDDVFTTVAHINWFIQEFVKMNRFDDEYLILKDIVGTIDPKMFFIMVSAEDVDILYAHENGQYINLTDNWGGITNNL